jgi:hypothetical protein
MGARVASLTRQGNLPCRGMVMAPQGEQNPAYTVPTGEILFDMEAFLGPLFLLILLQNLHKTIVQTFPFYLENPNG